MVRVSSPAKFRPWSELTAKMVMGVVPGFPGDFFQTFAGFPARNARETPVDGQRVPKRMYAVNCKLFWACLRCAVTILRH